MISVAASLENARHRYDLSVTVTDRDNQVDDAAVVIKVTRQVSVSFQPGAFSASEQNGTTTVFMELDRAPARDLTIPLTVTHNDGATEHDYFRMPEEIVFWAHSTSRHFILRITDDQWVDPGESLTIGLGTLPNGVSAGDPASVTINIADNDEASEPVTPWTATMTVAESGRYKGYDDDRDDAALGALSNTSFSWQDETYTVEEILLDDPGDFLHLTLSTALPNNGAGFTLNLGDHSFSLSGADEPGNPTYWDISQLESFGWNAGDTIAVSITHGGS